MYRQIAPDSYELPIHGKMRVPGLVIASQKMLENPEMEQPLKQVENVACLPGIVGYSIAMPDIHWGYGFPIGGVAAMDLDEGVISPGGVGYDINCGVRLALVPVLFKSLTENAKQELLKRIFQLVPSGVGRGHKERKKLSEKDYAAIVAEGARWSVRQGLGFEDDLAHCESLGFIEGGSTEVLSTVAKERGSEQLGTVGSGNHFVEIGEVQKIFDPIIAETWGITEGQTYILIHSGSRGFGHQICQDTLDDFIKQGFDKGLPDKQLVAAPIASEYGKRYFRAMAAAANFAFNNRQQILHYVRQAFEETLKISPPSIRMIYDVCHNIAKFETHLFEGKMRRLCVHRKGATRAYGPGAEELAPIFKKTGQPVLVPGDMGRASHLMAGLGNPLTWSSACHGAGRARSRFKSTKAWHGKDPIEHMKKEGVRVMAYSVRTIAEEMPDAYKDVDEVVQVVHDANLAKLVVRFKPHMVVKG